MFLFILVAGYGFLKMLYYFSLFRDNMQIEHVFLTPLLLKEQKILITEKRNYGYHCMVLMQLKVSEQEW